MTLVLLIRHAESVKNVRGAFASADQMEPLTDLGMSQATELAEALLNVSRTLTQSGDVVVWSGESMRSQQTAELVCDAVGAPLLVSAALRSFELPGLAGRSESELVAKESRELEDLLLYPAGLLNSYEIPGIAAPSRKFESEVWNWFWPAVTDSGASLVIVIAHRSPVTALSLAIARRVLAYPDDFYGHVEIGFCCSLAVRIDALRREPKEIEILGANIRPGQLANYVAGALGQ